MARRGNTVQTVDPAVEAEQQDECLTLWMKGFTQTQIAKKIGVSQPTVSNRIKKACEQIKSPAVAAYREMENERIDEQYAIAARIAHNETKDDDIRLKALDRMNRCTERRAKLMGLDAPVKVDMTTHEVSPAEIELQEMLREAAARSAVVEAQIKSGS